jgi:hypothetical protein
MNRFVQQSLCVGALLCAALTAQAAPTVVNGGFEAGDFTGWSLVGDQDYNVVAGDNPHTGDFSAFFGQTDAAATLSQSLATVAGHAYTVSFWLSNLGGSVNNIDTVNSFEILIDGAKLLDVQDKTATSYTKFQQAFTATSSSTVLAFSFKHDENFWLLDDVAVSEVPPTIPSVPEPSTVLMLALGLGALLLRRRLV